MTSSLPLKQPATIGALLRRRLREVKVVIQNKAVARWKSDELGWRRVA